MDSGANILEGLASHLTATNNATAQEQSDKAFNHDEFFQKEEDVPVSETFVCKRILFTPVGTSAVKAFDVCLLVPALAVLFLLFYTSPRCRQKLSGCPLVVLALHLATWATTAILLLRALLTIALPTQKDSENTLEKVTWALARASILALELIAIANIMLSFQASSKSSKRILSSVLFLSTLWFTVTLIIELLSPSAAFHVYELGYDLYAEGGGLYTAVSSGCLAFLYTLALAVRGRQHKSTPGRFHSLWFISLGLVLLCVRVVGGLLLVTGVQAGICLTSVSLYLETVCVPVLVFCLLLVPFLRHGQGHALLSYSVQRDDWVEEEGVSRREYRDSANIVRSEGSTLQGDSNQDLENNDDDYQI